MKKTITLLLSFFLVVITYGQTKIQSNFGISSKFLGKSISNLMFVNFIGVEIEDKLGIEYGYAYSINRDEQQLHNFIYGNSQSWTAGHLNHLIAFYYKTKRDEGTSINLGAGLSLLKEYNTSSIKTVSTPYLKLGLDQEFGKGWGGQINTGLGNVFTFTLGITKNL